MAAVTGAAVGGAASAALGMTVELRCVVVSAEGRPGRDDG